MRFFLLLLMPAFLLSDPWGKDADLTCVNKKYKKKYGLIYPTSDVEYEPCQTPVLGAFAEAGIWFHQNIISPADGPRSHYTPSSSQYTLDAIRAHGFFYGVTLGCDRLMRENDDPWIYPVHVLPDCSTLKYDPIPE